MFVPPSGLTRLPLACGRCGPGGLLALVADRRSASAPDSAAPSAARGPFRGQPHRACFRPVARALTTVAIRTTLEPLSGFATISPSNSRARHMLRAGALHFHPAIPAQDALHYGRPDGIAPLVSSPDLWSYLGGGPTAPWVTAHVVFDQAARLFSPSGHAPRAPTAGTRAPPRAYGLIYLAFRVFALAWWRLPCRDWFRFLLAATAVALPWYLRNWVKTGHPLQLPPRPPLPHQSHPRRISRNRPRPVSSRRAGIRLDLDRPLGLGLAGAPLVCRRLGRLADWRPRAPGLTAWLAMTGPRLRSLGQTSAGPGCAVRRLTPAVVLRAVLGGIRLARLAAPRARWLQRFALTTAPFDAGVRSLHLPVKAGVRWWPRDAAGWRDFIRDAAR